jgi:hypothetical protein
VTEAHQSDVGLMRPRGRPFQKGHKLAKGRVRGSKNRRTLAGEALMRTLEEGDGATLEPAAERWKRLLAEEDPAIRLAAERFVYQAVYGLPRARTDLSVEQVKAVSAEPMSLEEWSAKALTGVGRK